MEFLQQIILVIWTMYIIILYLVKRNKWDYSYFLYIIFIGLYIYTLFIKNQTTNVDIIQYATIFGLPIEILLKWYIEANKKDISENDYETVVNNLKETNITSEVLRNRFISTLELLSDGICFDEGNDMMFGSEKYMNFTGIESNYFSINDFYDIIYKDDKNKYIKTVEKLSKRNPNYSLTYRIKKDDELVWIKENGKAIFINKKLSRISMIKRLNPKRFPDTEIDVLNNLPGYKEMYNEVHSNIKDNSSFYLVIISLTNIPEINRKLGRDFGDLMMGEYLSKLRFKFLKDSNSLFRVEGIKFGFIIREKYKFDLLERALSHNGDPVNIEMVLGGVKETIYPNIGITKCTSHNLPTISVINQAITALETAMSNKVDASYYIHQ